MPDSTTTQSTGREKRVSRSTRALALALAIIIAHGAPLFPTLAAPAPKAPTVVSAPPAAAPAFDIEKVFPSGSLFVASISDFAKSSEAMKGTALYAIWNDPQVQKFLEKPRGIFDAQVEMAAQKMATAVKTPDGKPLDAKKILSVFGGEIALGLTGFTVPSGAMSNSNQPDIGLVLVFKIGDEAALDGLVATIESMAKSEDPNFERTKVTIAGSNAERMGLKGEPFQMYFAKSSGYAVFSVSEKSMSSILGGLSGAGASTLGSDANFVAVSKTTRRSTEIASLYVNFGGILANLEPVLPPQAKAAIDVLGIRSLQSMSVSSAFEGKGFIDTATVHTTGERKGIMRLADGPPVDAAVLNGVPKDVVSFSIFNFDVGVLWNSIWDTIKVVDAGKEAEARQMLASFESKVGVKFKEDVVDSLGSRMVTFQRPTMPGQMLPDFAFFLQVKAADRLRDAMGKLTKLASGVTLKEVKIAENTYYYVDLSAIAPIPFLQPSYAFVDDNIVLSLNLQSLKSIVNSRKSPTFASVKENEEFKTFLPKIPQGATSIGYSDVKKSFGGSYDQVRQLVPLFAMQLGTEMPVDLALLPTSDAFTRHLYGSYSYTLDSGADSTTVSVGPMSLLIIGGLAGAIGGAGALVWGRPASMSMNAPVPVEVEEEGDEESEPR